MIVRATTKARPFLRETFVTLVCLRRMPSSEEYRKRAKGPIPTTIVAPTLAPFLQIENRYMFRNVCGFAASNACHASRSVSASAAGSRCRKILQSNGVRSADVGKAQQCLPQPGQERFERNAANDCRAEQHRRKVFWAMAAISPLPNTLSFL